MQLFYHEMVGKKREPDRLSVTNPKYNCEKHAFKRIRFTSYCRTMNESNGNRGKRWFLSSLCPSIRVQYITVLLSRYEEIVIRHFDSASQILHIYLGDRSSNSIAAYEKQKGKYRVFRSIKYTYCVCLRVCMCVCVCARARGHACARARARVCTRAYVFVYVCVSYIVYWSCKRALTFFFQILSRPSLFHKKN